MQVNLELSENYSSLQQITHEPEEQQNDLTTNIKREKPCSKERIMLAIFIVIIFAWDFIYYSQERYCSLDIEGDCFQQMIFINVINIGFTIMILSFIQAILIVSTASIHSLRKYFKFIVINLIVIVWALNDNPSLYNYSYFYTIFVVVLTMLFVGFFLPFIGFFYLTKKLYNIRKIYLLPCLVSLFGFALLISGIYDMLLKTHDSWQHNWFDQHIQDFSPQGDRYPNFKVPERDWYNLLSGVQDASRFLYDCTSEPFNTFDAKRKVLHKFIPQSMNNRYLAFPRLQDLPYAFDRYWIQPYLLANIKAFTDLDLIPPETEYVLDIEKLEYTIDVKRNETLIAERSILRQKREDQIKEAKIERRLPKNIIMLYIDAISRKRLASKLPQLQKWLQAFEEKFKQNNIFKNNSSNSHQLFKGVRSTNIAWYTYPNLQAYFYGSISDTTFDQNTSDYSMTMGATNIDVQSEDDTVIDQYSTKDVYKKKLKHYSFINDFKSAGQQTFNIPKSYITGLTYTDCNTNPMDLDGRGVVLNETFDNIIYDHMGFLHSCDPNFFNPNNFEGIGQGPNSIFRRCLYKKEQIDYTNEYAKSFMTKYKDQPKFLQLGFMEAHEGTQEVITHMDQKFVQLLQWLEDENSFEDSIFLFLSDHGMHLNNLMNYFKAEVNQIEGRLPIQLLYIDKKLLNPIDLINLNENQQRLTTMFEVHYLYKYLLNVENSTFYRDNSLVSDKIPINRQLYDLQRFKPFPIQEDRE